MARLSTPEENPDFLRYCAIISFTDFTATDIVGDFLSVGGLSAVWAHSSMDRVQASGACGMGSNPIGPFLK